jgi:probable HAF family extracellular repeat protein
VDVNNGGLVVGTGLLIPRLTYFEPRHAFTWTESTAMVDLGTLGGRDSAAVDVNDDGQVVGWSYTVGSLDSDGSIRHAFLWSAPNGMVSLGTLGGTNSEATAVNAHGGVVGQSDVTPGSSLVHAFLSTRDHEMTDLGTLGGSFSTALDLNDRGQVVGWSLTADPAVHRGFVWTAATGIVPTAWVCRQRGPVREQQRFCRGCQLHYG